MLTRFPVDYWNCRRYENFVHFIDCLSGLSEVTILLPSATIGTPLGVFLHFNNTEIREVVRLSLISRKVYPLILWTFSDRLKRKLPLECTEFSERTLMIPCDARYNRKSIERAAEIVKNSIKSE